VDPVTLILTALAAGASAMLRSRNNLAETYRAAGRLGEAIPFPERTLADCVREQALAGLERVLGEDHPTTVGTRKNLAIARRQAGQRGKGTGHLR
jgi:hypothetical protein